MSTPQNVARLLFILMCFVFISTPTFAEEKSKQQEVVDSSVVVLERFSTDANMEYFRNMVKKAKAVFIVPRMLKGGFVIGGSGGSGVLLANDEETGAWSYPVFYTMGSVSLGLQAGAEASQIILLIMTKKGMDSMLGTSIKLGADASIAAGPFGGGAKVATTDILAYALSKGVYGGLSIEGATITSRDKWNTSYYGKSVTPVDVIVRKTVSNKEAEPLREAVEKITK